MDDMLARTIIETLAKGINPLTGWILSENDSCAQEEIQEALKIVLEHCSIESTAEYLKSLPRNKRQNVILALEQHGRKKKNVNYCGSTSRGTASNEFL